MPQYYLELSVETLENVVELRTDKVTRWEFTVSCSHCGTEHGKTVAAEAGKTSAMPGSRGEAHIVFKCKQCERTSSIEWIEGAKKGVKVDGAVRATDVTTRVAAFECRGLEPVRLNAGRCGPFVAVAASKTLFENVVFDDGDFTEFDDEGDVPVSVLGLKAAFVRG